MASAHHGAEEIRRQKELLAMFGNQVAAKAQRKWPEGRIAAEDDGELAIMIATDPAKNVVRFEFGKPVAWLAMPPEQAKELGELMIRRANELTGEK